MQQRRSSLLVLAVGLASLAQGSEVVVDATKKFQRIDGFGTCLISWDDRMTAWYQRPEASRIFGEELRFNILRCNLWGDGTIAATDNIDKISFRDPEFARRDPRTPVFLRFAKDVIKYQPHLKVIGTVWSPPAWMKDNNSITDTKSGAISGENYNSDKGGEIRNRVLRNRYPAFAKWAVEMVKYYQSQGVPMYALSAANDPQFTQSFESCVWTAKDLATVSGMIGDLLLRDGLGHIRLFGPETMTGFNWEGGPNYRYTQAFRENPPAWRGLGMWATHGYADGVKADVSTNSSAKFWSIVDRDDKPYWVTEGGTGGHAWPAPVKPGGVGLAIHNALVAGNASAFVPWQYAENSRSEHNLMPLSGLDKKTNVVRHYSRYIPAGSVRVGTNSGYGEVNVSAFRHGKDLTIVILNPGGQAQTVALNVRGITVKQFNVIRTSESEDSKVLSALSFSGGKATLEVPGPGIVTLTTLKP